MCREFRVFRMRFVCFVRFVCVLCVSYISCAFRVLRAAAGRFIFVGPPRLSIGDSPLTYLDSGKYRAKD